MTHHTRPYYRVRLDHPTGIAHETLRARAAAKQQAYAGLWSRLLEVEADNPVTVAVLTLHAPEVAHTDWQGDPVLVCYGCDAEGFEVESPSWPCSTTVAVADVYGIDVPEVIA